MLPGALAFLNVGGTELLLLVVLVLAFFGADKLPDIARAVGRVRAEAAKATRAVERELESAEDREFREQVAFEREREAHVKAQSDEGRETLALRSAADALGVDWQGKSADEVKTAIRARVGAEDEETKP